jgi:hypothetical protein
MTLDNTGVLTIPGKLVVNNTYNTAAGVDITAGVYSIISGGAFSNNLAYYNSAWRYLNPNVNPSSIICNFDSSTAGFLIAPPNAGAADATATLGYVWSAKSNASQFNIHSMSTALYGATHPTNPHSAHLVLPAVGIIAANGTLTVAANVLYESGPVWKYTTTNYGLAYTQSISTGEHKLWTAPSGTAGNTATFTEKFRVGQATSLSLQAFQIENGALQVQGSHTPSPGGGSEMHYLDGQGYFQTLDRNGTIWKPVNVNGKVVNLSYGTDGSSAAVKGGVDSNGLFGVAQQKAGDPTTTEIPNGYWRVVENTSAAQIKLWYNDNGVFRSVTLS